MTADNMTAYILKAHNTKRNRVAMGQEPPFLSAQRMAQMVWDDQLAFLAELNTKSCMIKHDACRNTPTIRYSGQNLASMGTTGAHFNGTYVIDQSINMWYNEFSYATPADIGNLTRINDDLRYFYEIFLNF